MKTSTIQKLSTFYIYVEISLSNNNYRNTNDMSTLCFSCHYYHHYIECSDRIQFILALKKYLHQKKIWLLIQNLRKTPLRVLFLGHWNVFSYVFPTRPVDICRRRYFSLRSLRMSDMMRFHLPIGNHPWVIRYSQMVMRVRRKSTRNMTCIYTYLLT